MIKMRKFKEEIYGNLATVYHRTSYSNLINAVYTEGFKPGSGAMYGKGFYSTYDLDSQENQEMKEVYGNIVVKFSVSIEKFFIFDYSEFIKSPNYKKLRSKKDTFLMDQIKYFNISLNHNVNLNYEGHRFSSSSAEYVYKHSNLYSRVEGIIFTGDSDGRVLVAYNTNLIIPISYRLDGEKDFTKVERNKAYFKQVLMNKLKPQNVDSLNTYFSWIKRISTENMKYHIDKDNNFVWESGTFCMGKWLRGIWLDGIWEQGNWVGGQIYSKKYSVLVTSSVDPNEFYDLEKKVQSLEDLKKRVE